MGLWYKISLLSRHDDAAYADIHYIRFYARHLNDADHFNDHLSLLLLTVLHHSGCTATIRPFHVIDAF